MDIEAENQASQCHELEIRLIDPIITQGVSGASTEGR